MQILSKHLANKACRIQKKAILQTTLVRGLGLEWILQCTDSAIAERLTQDVRKAMSNNDNNIIYIELIEKERSDSEVKIVNFKGKDRTIAHTGDASYRSPGEGFNSTLRCWLTTSYNNS